MKKYILGIDIGGTKIKSSVIDENGVILEQGEVPTEDDSPERGLWKKKAIDLINEKSKQYGRNDQSEFKVGISAPGLIDRYNRMTLHMPERLKGIENYNWAQELNQNICVVNDGHAACLGEYESYYRQQGVKNLILVTLGTGVGGGIIIDGKLYQGNIQRAGSVGHMTVDINGPPTMTNMPGSLEYAVGNFSVRERTRGKYNSVRELVAAYEDGNSQAKKWWLESVRKLAGGLASLINILSPEQIVLGGGIAAGAGDALFVPLQKYMSEYEWRPGGCQTPIAKAESGKYAGAIGAAFFANRKLFNDD